jgi:hypothetical protein
MGQSVAFPIHHRIVITPDAITPDVITTPDAIT